MERKKKRTWRNQVNHLENKSILLIFFIKNVIIFLDKKQFLNLCDFT